MEKIDICGPDRCNTTEDSLFGSLSSTLQANINTSYCLLVELQHPLCSRADSSRLESACVLAVETPAVCSPELWPPQF